MNWRRILVLLLAFALAAACCGCFLLKSGNRQDREDPSDTQEQEGGEAQPGFPVSVNGYTVRSRPESVVSLSPSLTEKIGDLGLTDRLAGVSDYTDYPAAAAELPGCGTAQLPDLQAIEQIAPQLVLAEGELPEDALRRLEELEIDTVVLTRPADLEQWKAGYRALLQALEGAEAGGERADEFLRELQLQLDALGRFAAYADADKRKSALYLRMLDYIVATGETLEHELLGLIGLDNIAAEYSGWLIPAEDAQKEAVRASFESLDILFLHNAGDSRDRVRIEDLERHAYYSGLRAVVEDRYLYVDSALFERQGLRMLEQLEEMGAAAYPGAPGVSDRSRNGDDGAETQNDGPEEAGDGSRAPSEGD